MSIRFNGNAANFLSRTTSLPDYNSAYTVMGWVKIVNDTNDRATFFILSTANANNRDIAQFNTDGTTLVMASRKDGVGGLGNGDNISVGAWRHFAMVRSDASNLDFYLDSVLHTSADADMTGRTAMDVFEFGRTNTNSFTGEPLDCECAHFRVWTTALTQAEIATEKDSATVVKTASLYGVYPMATGATAGDDSSGQSHPFTVNGTITTGASEPPIGNLIIQNASHAHTATNIDIDTGVHNLVIQNATHAHTSSAISFTSAPPEYVRGGFNSGSGITTAQFTSNNAGDLLVVAIRAAGGTFATPTDTAGNSYLPVGELTDPSGGKVKMWYADNCAASAGANTVTITGGTGFTRITLVEYKEVAATSALRIASTNSGNSTTMSTGPIAGFRGDLIVAYLYGYYDGTFAAGPGYTKRQGDASDGLEDKLSTLAIENATATNTPARNWAAIGAAFIPANNPPPVAHAGFNQTRMEFETVMLDSSQSYDDLGIVSRLWGQVSGTSVTLLNPTSVNPAFVAPDVAVNTDLVFRVTVTDAEGLTDQAEVTITIVPTGSTTWLWHTPQEAGFDPDEFYAAMNSPGMLPPSMVIRNGRIIGTKGDVTAEGFIWSACKSLVALIFARQLQLGNVSYAGTVPGSDNPTTPLATYEQFLAMLSDYALDPHSPGNQFAYNNLAVHHYGTHLKTTFYAGRNHVETLQDAYVTTLDFEDTLTYDAASLMSGWGGGWSMSTRDLARIHQLVLQGGVWEGTQILDANFCNTELYELQVPATATLNPDFDDPQSNESLQQGLDLADGYSFGFWLSHLTPHINGVSQNEACGMSGAFGTSSYISRAKNIIVVASNVGGTTINDNSVKISGATFDLFADALPEQRANSRLSRSSLHGFFDDEELNRTDFWEPPIDDSTPLVIQGSSHSHTADSLTLTQTHSLAIQDATHGHAGQNVVLFFTARASSRLYRGSLFAFFDDEDLNRTEFWDVSVTANLTIQAGSHSHSAENLVLTQTHELAIQSTAHSQTSDNLALTQVHSLTVQNASHTHSVDALSISQIHELAIASVSHDHTAQNLILTTEGSLAIANSPHSHTVESLALTQVHELSIDGSAHGHTADNAALTQVHSLTVQDGSHTHTAENVILTQIHGLATDNATHGHTSDNLTMAQAHGLVVANSSHAHTAENLTLVGAGDLTIQSAIHAHNTQSLTLTQAHVLSLANGAHAHAVDSFALTQVHNLTVDAATHSHSAESLTLAQSHSLVVASASHGHVSDSPSVSQVHSLAIQNSLLNHTVESLTLTQTHGLIVSAGIHAHAAESLDLGIEGTLGIANCLHGHTADSLVLSGEHNLLLDNGIHVLSSTNITLTQVYELVIAGSIHAHTVDKVHFGGTGRANNPQRFAAARNDSRRFATASVSTQTDVSVRRGH